MRYICVRNWDKHQHYRDRNPPWIKLHRELLTSHTWAGADDASRALAIAIMLLAAANGNRIPADPAYIKRVAYLNSDPDFTFLLSSEFIDIIEEKDGASVMLADASKMQAFARSEKETEGELETETEKRVKGPDGPDPVLVAFNDWNKLAEEIGLAKALKLTDQRRRALKARLDDCGGIVGWVKVMDAVRNSPFLKGQNDRNWQADLDFVLKASSFIKIQEGKYAPKNGFSSIDWKKVLGDDFDPAASV